MMTYLVEAKKFTNFNNYLTVYSHSSPSYARGSNNNVTLVPIRSLLLIYLLKNIPSFGVRGWEGEKGII